MNIPRNEHPNPQFERKNWLCLNGEWDFEIDNGKSGKARGLYKSNAILNSKITVPFCPESKLSGVENKDFMYCVWYKKEIDISKEEKEKLTFLHFGAVDYETVVYVNGITAGTHKGGYTSFKLDISDFLNTGKNIITVCAFDDVRNPMIPRGKQSEEYFSHACDYTRTTGIWQSVWLEFVPKTHIAGVKYYPDTKKASLFIEAELKGSGNFKAVALYDGKIVGEVEGFSQGGTENFEIKLTEKHLWEVGQGRLYTLKLSYGDDEVKSYFGLRNVRLEGYKFLLNDKSVFQRLVLDQGFYPDGIYTAPTDEALLNDIIISKKAGFNGARLHEKIFEPRFLYHCDKEGYLVWGEYPNWGLDHSKHEALFSILPEWIEELERDFNHPSIIGWCPFNETWDVRGNRQNDEVLRIIYKTTKQLDSTRPCIDTSGNFHVETDIFDIHDYDQNPITFNERYSSLSEDKSITDRHINRQNYNNEPIFISEYGGIKWSLDETGGWGYGNAPKSEDEFKERYKGLTDAILDNPCLFGFCYTQLYDIEQEQNGLYTYDRQAKFDMNYFYKVNSRKAVIED